LAQPFASLAPFLLSINASKSRTANRRSPRSRIRQNGISPDLTISSKDRFEMPSNSAASFAPTAKLSLLAFRFIEFLCRPDSRWRLLPRCATQRQEIYRRSQGLATGLCKYFRRRDFRHFVTLWQIETWHWKRFFLVLPHEHETCTHKAARHCRRIARNRRGTARRAAGIRISSGTRAAGGGRYMPVVREIYRQADQITRIARRMLPRAETSYSRRKNHGS